MDKQVIEVDDIHDAVGHARLPPTDTEGVASADAKLRPNIVILLPPVES